MNFRPSAAAGGRFRKIAVYFFGIRLFVWTFVEKINNILKTVTKWFFAEMKTEEVIKLLEARSCFN